MKTANCITCGDTNPENFYKGNKSYCIKCYSENSKRKYVKKARQSKPYQCKHCGDLDESHFYSGWKSCCKTCYTVTEKSEEQIQKQKEQQQKWKDSNILLIRLKSARNRAQSKGFDFDLTLEDLQTIYNEQDGKCFYSGRKFDTSNPNNSLSIDRTDSKIGYVKSNIRLVCSIVNFVKHTYDTEVFLSLIKDIYEHKKFLRK